MRTETGAGSWFVISRTARVGRPLTSLTPKISESGKEVLMSTAILGVVPTVDSSSIESWNPSTSSTWVGRR